MIHYPGPRRTGYSVCIWAAAGPTEKDASLSMYYGVHMYHGVQGKLLEGEMEKG